MTDHGTTDTFASTSDQTWVRAADRPLWAAVHRPRDGRAAGVVVIASGTGLEAVTLYRYSARLAHELAAAGLVAIRFSWSGDGDSAPIPPGADPGEVWQGDLAAVLDLATELAPGAPVHLVATRLAASVTPDRPLASILHVEPVGGRTHLRAHQMLRKLGTPVDLMPSEVGEEVNGTVWTPSQAAALKKLKPVTGEQVQVVQVPEDQATTFFSVAPQLAVVPAGVLDDIVSRLRGPATHEVAAWTPTTTASFDVDGRTVTEELTFAGPHRLAAVVTRPEDGQVTAAVSFTAPGSEPRSAPIGLFAGLAREAAAAGALAVRADRRGLGENAAIDAAHAPVVYSAEAVEDVVETAREASRLAPGVPAVGVGACVGSWLYLKAAPQLDLHRLVAIEALAWDPNPDAYLWVPGTLEIAYNGKRFATALRTPPGLGETSAKDRVLRLAVGVAKTIAKRVLAFGVAHCPAPVWGQLARRRLVQDPMPLLLDLPRDTELELVLGPFAGSAFDRSRGEASVAEARRQGVKVQVRRHEQFDHSIFSAHARETTRATVLDAVREAAASTTR